VSLQNHTDQGNRAVIISADGVTGLGAPINLTASMVGTLSILGGTFSTSSSTYTITGTPALKDLYLNTFGQDTVTVNGSTANLHLFGGSSATLVVNDQASPPDPARVYTITATSFTRTDPVQPARSISFGGFGTNVFNTSGTVNVQGTAAGTTTTVNAGAGDDTINVGSADNLLDGILGVLNIDGQGGKNTLNVNDQASTTPHTYKVTSTSVTRTNPGSVTINYSDIEHLHVHKGAIAGSFPQGAAPVPARHSAALGDRLVQANGGEWLPAWAGDGPGQTEGLDLVFASLGERLLNGKARKEAVFGSP